ncbi:MAG: hypothetical protein ACI9K2_004004 [Myxococcota bacterium]|jgi:hypothetical protein
MGRAEREGTEMADGAVYSNLRGGRMRQAWLALWIVLGCGPEPKDDKPPAEICDNAEDDDLDELADCADPDCSAKCGEVCTNGTDDDLDGLIDCLDDDCDGLCPENCGDGRDNDGDGAIDCDDRDCFGSCPEVCGDGFDNDGDGKVDCLDEECVEPSCAEVCTDGRDNDADALVDCADDDCNDPSCAENCIDGRDNDADGRVDCDDTDCDGDCPEVCDDGRDNDADGRVDCDDDECDAVCDADGDGFVNEAFGGDDCDDTRPDVNPRRQEICNGDEALDDDCDGLVDEDDPDVDVFTLIAWGPDADGDGFGTDADVRFACQQPDGWGFAGRDCDDSRDDINPEMPEICNPDVPVDDDCDGLVDDADPDMTEDSYLEWYADRDRDGFGAEDDFVYACSRPDGTAATNDDCDDADPTVGPPSLWLEDGDGDGFGAGDPADPVPTCDPPGPGLFPDWRGIDCDPGDPTIFPGAEEVCEDGIDQDCDGADAECFVDPFDFWRADLWASHPPGFDYVDGSLLVTGGDAVMRSIETYEIAQILGSLNKDASCSDHFVVLSTSPSFTWSWSSVPGAMKFVWNCDTKYIYAPVGSDSVSCSMVGDYDIEVEIVGDRATFRDSRCADLTMTDPILTGPLYVYVGADCDACTAEWYSLAVYD